MSQYRRSIVEPDLPGRASDIQANDRTRRQQLGAETLRLPACPVGELVAGHTIGKTEVVLNSGALPRLTPSCGPLDNHGLEALRCGVHGSAQAGRAATNDHNVIELALRGGAQANCVRDLDKAGLN